MQEQIKDNYYGVLDHGFIALKDMMGSDTAIEEMARVSYQAGTRKTSDTRGLLRYLMRLGHSSPFERVEFVFHVGLPIFVARQWIRHRTASVNEYSGRYSIMPMLFYTPDQERAQLQSETNKQGSSDDRLTKTEYELYHGGCGFVRDREKEHYYKNLEAGMSRELARLDLPLSMYTYWHWKIDLHNLFHFLSLRLDPHAQWEIRQYANVIAHLVQKTCPLAYEAFYDYRLNSKSFSRMEMNLLQHNMLSGLTLLDPNGGLDTHADKMACELGMTGREIREFCDKIVTPNLNLNPLPDPLPAQHFEDKIEEASE